MKKIQTLFIIIVLAIIGAYILQNTKYLEDFKKTNDLRRKSDLKTLQTALENYYQNHGRYPKSSQKNPLFRIVRLDDSVADWGQQWIPYLTVLPKDPSEAKNYIYYSDLEAGQSYYIYASLDNSTDKELCFYKNGVKDYKCRNVPSNASCGGVCNYGLSSANVNP
ncbi:MAG: type II secretion system protein GspG [Candidatus Levyibacteriota bacterium]